MGIIKRTLIVIFVLFVNQLFAQTNFIFGVNSTPSINIGLKFNNIVITFGTDFLYNSDKHKRVIFEDVSEAEYSLFRIDPAIGLKVYLYEEEFSPFFFGIVSKGVPISIKIKGDYSQTKKEIRDINDDFYFRFGGGGDFLLKESLMVGFDIGLYLSPGDYKSPSTESETMFVSSFSRVTLTYIFK